MKTISAILLILGTLFAPRAFALDPAELNTYIDLCNKSRNEFTAIRPLFGVPGVLGAELKRTTFADLCDLMVQLQSLGYRMEDLKAKFQLNNSTELSWDKALILGLSIGSLAASKYYSEAQPTDIAEIEDKREREALRSFYESIGERDQLEVSKFKDNREQANKMDEFAKITRQRAMLSESLICPDRSDNPDYRAIYEQTLKPLGIKRQEYEAKRDHYFERLKEIGPTFLRDEPYDTYSQELQSLHEIGVIVMVGEETKPANYYKKKAPKTEGDPAQTVTDKTKVTTQQFRSNVNTRAFDNFRERWKSRWKDHVNDSLSRFDKAADITQDCVIQPGRPAKTDWLSPDDVNSLASYERSCFFSLTKSREAQPGFVFDEVVKRYEENSIKFGEIQAQIWTKESELLKRPVVFDQRKDGGIRFTDRPNCNDEPMNAATILMTKNKMLEVENQYKEIIAREKIKDSMLREEEMRRQKELADQSRLKRQKIQNDNTEQKRAISIIVSPDLGGGL